MHRGKTGCSNSKNNMHGTEIDEEREDRLQEAREREHE